MIKNFIFKKFEGIKLTFLSIINLYKTLIVILKHPNGLYLLSFGCLLRFLAETHIILYRNFLVSDKSVS